MTKLIHPITFIDKLVKKNERGYSFSLMDHQPEICLGPPSTKTAGCRGVGHDSLFLIKKSGKTTLTEP